MNAGFVMCQNPACRLILDLREARYSIRRSALLTRGCPECGHPWAARCPLCSHPLVVVGKARQWRCRSCERAKADQPAGGMTGVRVSGVRRSDGKPPRGSSGGIRSGKHGSANDLSSSPDRMDERRMGL